MALDNTYVNRIEGLFYSKSDEKFTVRALLDEIFGERTFGSALDIGPGAGYISEPLARRSKHLKMVEKQAKFEETLRAQFPAADVSIGSFTEVPLQGPYDVILLSHVLYYHPENTWISLLQRLHKLLAPGGELIVALNSDTGDWWKIVNLYWGELRPHLSFNYIPLTQARKEFAEIGSLQVHPYRYQMWVEPGPTWSEFVGTQILELSDEALRRRYDDSFQDLAKTFKQIDGNIVLDFRAEIIRIKA